MKISDFIFSYKSCRRVSICRVRIFVPTANRVIVVLTDLGSKNIGASITNSLESLVSALLAKGYVDDKAKFIEHYESSLGGMPSFDLVSFDGANDPSWETLSLESVIELLECNKDEFELSSLENKRLFDEVERIRHKIDPFIGEPYRESHIVINKRDEIKNNMIESVDLQKLIDNGANERTIQNLLKKDLSVFPEVFSTTEEEYICMSEYPIDGKPVDFIMLSGRSRMDVTLIEIKGANYSLLNKTSYRDFSAKTNQAVQQARTKAGFVYRNYEKFRNEIHNVRSQLEEGKKKCNFLIGPQGDLQVDPNKDINIRTVVIGGVGNNDVEESRLRHDFERTSSPPIRIESWTSFLKKLTRD